MQSLAHTGNEEKRTARRCGRLVGAAQSVFNFVESYGKYRPAAAPDLSKTSRTLIGVRRRGFDVEASICKTALNAPNQH